MKNFFELSKNLFIFFANFVKTEVEILFLRKAKDKLIFLLKKIFYKSKLYSAI